MRVVAFLSWKYLIKKKSSQAIHLITAISIVGITIGTAALIIVLSVFNGFEELLNGMFSKYNPDIKIVSVDSGFFEKDSAIVAELKTWSEIQAVAACLDITGMIQYDDVQDFGTIRGIESNFKEVVPLDSALMEGSLLDPSLDYHQTLIGLGLANKLGVSLNNISTRVYLYIPTSYAEESKEIRADQYGKNAVSPVGIFSLHQELDNEMVMVPLSDLQEWSGAENKLSSIEIKVKSGISSLNLMEKLQKFLGPQFIVKDRYRQDEAFLKIMNLEKWLFFLLFSLTLVLVSFTIMGALWMIVLEKRLDISILKSIGMSNRSLQKVFLLLGLGIGAIGLVSGFALAIGFYLLQNHYALIRVPEEFIIDSYPIALKSADFVTVSCTVMAICLMASLLPVAKISEVKAIFREE
ncbi:MAG: ABC transporter permease [Saprospiraceae bacterium]|nr:ABC transporter permease [Saprospiraceae bacterium]